MPPPSRAWTASALYFVLTPNFESVPLTVMYYVAEESGRFLLAKL
jgi:hypothetical protein